MSRRTAPSAFPSPVAFAMFGPFAFWLPVMAALGGAGLRVPMGGCGMVRIGARKGGRE